MERLQVVDLESGEKAKGAVRHNAENDPTWKHFELARRLYGWTDIFRERFLDPIARIDRGKLPGPVLGFDKEDYRILAWYRLGKNAFGLDDEIILNEVNLERPLYSVLETVLHEQVHLWQQRFGEHPVKRNYHNQEFVDKCESLGLHPLPVVGAHWKPADGPFEQLLKEHDLLRPSFEPVPEGEKREYWMPPGRKKGRSTLTLWECPGCELKVRVGVSKDIELACMPCTRERNAPVTLIKKQ